MRGTVKWFNYQKGYGFIIDSEGKDYFFHHSSIQMEGFRTLNEGDIVEFELGNDATGREQAVNVQPVLTRKMVRYALKNENLQLRIIKDAMRGKAYMVVDANNVIQAGEKGMSLIEIAAYVGIDVEGLE